MKIVYICGSPQHYDYGIRKIMDITKNIFSELGVETHAHDLDIIHPPYYEGETHQSIDSIIEDLKTANGVVFACTTQVFAPTALMQCFLEYLEQPEYSDVLKDKHCFLITVSQGKGEKSALDYMSKVIKYFGGYDKWQLGLQISHINEIETNPDLKQIIERETEDFYRGANQNRKYIIPQDFPLNTSQSVPLSQVPATTGLPNIVDSAIQPKQDLFTEQQEKDIEELSRLFSQKYSGGETPLTDVPQVDIPRAAVPPIMQVELTDNMPIAPGPSRAKTAKQITQSLPHYFQPQLSSGLQAVIQLNISGSETFEGFLYIHSTECTYTEGVAPAPDVTIMADTAL